MMESSDVGKGNMEAWESEMVLYEAPSASLGAMALFSDGSGKSAVNR